jgi:hypothetical protein
MVETVGDVPTIDRKVEVMVRRGWFVVLLLFLALVPCIAFAEEAAEVLPPGTPAWAHLVYVIITAVIGTIAVPFLARKAQAAKEEAAKLRTEGALTSLNARKVLIMELKNFLLDHCITVLEREIPNLAARVLTEKLGKDDIKAVLRKWGYQARAAAVEYFASQGVDLVATVGDAYLDAAIRWAADRVSPFPGKETAVELATEKYSNMLIEKGVDYVRNRISNENLSIDRKPTE